MRDLINLLTYKVRVKGVTRSAWAAAERNVNAFNGRSVESALGALDLPSAEESNQIDIDVPDVAENSANVPVEVTVRIPGVERVLVVGERNVLKRQHPVSTAGEYCFDQAA